MSAAAVPQAVLVTTPAAHPQDGEDPGFFSKTWSWMSENKIAAAIIVILVILVIYLGLSYMGWDSYFTGSSSESKPAKKKKKSPSRSGGGRQAPQETETDDVDELIDIINE